MRRDARRAAFCLALALVLATLGLFAAPPRAAADGDSPPAADAAGVPVAPPGSPTVVTVGFHVFQVREVNLKAQTFFADFYLWVRFRAPDAEAAKELERLEFMNGKPDAREELDRKVVNGETYICWRVAGTFAFSAQLQNYPFDTQFFEIILEHPSLESEAVAYADDEASYGRSEVAPKMWGAREGLDIPEFTLRETYRWPGQTVYKTDFGDPSREQAASTYSRFTLSMRFARDFMPYFFKIVIPLFVIMSMAYLVFFLPAKEIQTASTLSVTALLSCIAFNITVAGNLPEVGYLVVSDKFFLATYILLFLTLLHSVLTYAWHEKGRDALAVKWEKVARLVFPALYILAFGFLFIEALLSA